MRLSSLILAIGFIASWAAAQVLQQNSIVNSPHNLSSGGPGPVRAAGEQEICIFCHTPHNSTAIQPLWNRTLPVSQYQVYSSNSLKAKPGQPTGSSKLCLSCHDGTIAIGSVYSRNQPILMAGGVTTIPPGKANLGTDLRDDHPISFRYDTELVGKNSKLRNPLALPQSIHLDKNQELQCTSCHDPHNDSRGKFLVLDNTTSALCSSCHVMGTTNVANHVNCSACHQSHTAPSGPYLLKAAKISDTCLECHGAGTKPPQGPNVSADLAKVSKHDTSSEINIANPLPANITCADCHDPHTMTTATAVAPRIRGNFGKVSGVNTAGGPVASAEFEYEVCFKCHADQSAVAPIVPRVIVQTNRRLQFDSTAISFHPVEVTGKSTNVPSLKPPLTTSSIIYCSDCHSSDSGHSAGGTGPDGTHGSDHRPLLVAPYNMLDRVAEGPGVYALCYRCHDRNIMLANPDTFGTLHKLHVVDQQAPCGACHDPHGIGSNQGMTTNNSHLINFNTEMVTRSSNGRLEYITTSPSSGRCSLTCHGVDHIDFPYPLTGAQPLRRLQTPLSLPTLRPAAPRATPKPARGRN